MRRIPSRCGLLAWGLALTCSTSTALGKRFDFQLERYEPTVPGSWTFAVDRPSYAREETLVAGITLDYGHNPLLSGRLESNGSFARDISVISHQLVGHFEIAGSFADRMALAASFPLTLLERGTAVDGVAPLDGMAVGDPRLALFVRLWGHSDRSPLAIHAGTELWIPIGADTSHAGDTTLRVQPKLVLSGILYRHVTHSLSLGMLFRPGGEVSSDSIDAAARIGHEMHLGGAVGWTNLQQTWHTGIETVASTTIVHSELLGQDSTSVDLLAGGQICLLEKLWVGMAIGTGVMREPGTADVRLIGRIAYAPRAKPAAQSEVIPTGDEAPPRSNSTPGRTPSQAPSRSWDDVADKDPCPESPVGAFPRECRPVGVLDDRDGDHVPDRLDQCPNLSSASHPDPDNLGCPVPDVIPSRRVDPNPK